MRFEVHQMNVNHYYINIWMKVDRVDYWILHFVQANSMLYILIFCYSQNQNYRYLNLLTNWDHINSLAAKGAHE